MNENEERAYEQGSQMAWQAMLSECLRHLAPHGPLTVERLVLERAAAISVLRRLCADHGDNEWDDDLHLADILEKHLERHLGS